MQRPPMQSAPTASRLLVIATGAALRLYSEWLEQAGYNSRPAGSLKEVEQICRSESIDLILVSDTVDAKVKKAIGLTIRHFCPATPILQVGRTRPDVEGNSFVTGSSREDMLRSVRRILQHEDIPPAAL